MKTKYLALVLLVLFCSSCRKWLDTKSNKADVTPASLADYQAIMDNDLTMNDGTVSGLSVISADNYYSAYTTWQGRSTLERNAYLWASEIYDGIAVPDWARDYKVIECANIVLEGTGSIPVDDVNKTQLNNVKGQALFMRAYALFNLMQTFAPPYTAATAKTDLGVPVRLGTDVNEVSVRATVAQVYDQIVADMKRAEDLLPDLPAFQTRPSKASVFGMLAKVYLNTGDYNQSYNYADKALATYKSLIDFNTINATATLSFSSYPNNVEVIYYNTALFYSLMQNANPIVDSSLYQSYSANDLRKTVFYRLNGTLPMFKGTYAGKLNTIFAGIATNELYLIRAEDNARLGNIAASMTDLNTLLQKRWKTGTFASFTATTETDALTKILTERRKELPFTGSIRWEDLRRLNQDARFARSITRVLNGQTYTLAPNDKKYTLPIPDEEIRLSGLQQNPR